MQWSDGTYDASILQKNLKDYKILESILQWLVVAEIIISYIW